MSLYKTQRCRHFDEAGHPIKPYCSQGSKCRFIHPNDHQWTKLKRRADDSPSPGHREPARSMGKNKLQFSPGSPPQHQRSLPLAPQTDISRCKQKDNTREHDRRDWPARDGGRRRDSDSWSYSRDRDGPFEQGFSLKRPSDHGDPYPNQRPRLSERASCGSVSRSDARHTIQTDKTTRPVPNAPAHDPKATTKLSDTFHRLAKLCCEIVQDTCFLDREEDKLKAFTGLSSELSRAVPDTAMAVTPALATVITGHTRTRERLENHMEELETLWKTLFSVIEGDIAKVIDSRLEQAITLLGNERDNALRLIAHSQKPVGDRPHENGTTRSRQWTDSRRETGVDRTTTLPERSTASVNGMNAPPEGARHHGGPASLSLVPTQEMDLGMSLRIVLEDMKMQMDRQTRAIELLAKENLQLKSATECPPSQLVSPDSASPPPRKPSLL